MALMWKGYHFAQAAILVHFLGKGLYLCHWHQPVCRAMKYHRGVRQTAHLPHRRVPVQVDGAATEAQQPCTKPYLWPSLAPTLGKVEVEYWIEKYQAGKIQSRPLQSSHGRQLSPAARSRQDHLGRVNTNRIGALLQELDAATHVLDSINRRPRSRVREEAAGFTASHHSLVPLADSERIGVELRRCATQPAAAMDEDDATSPCWRTRGMA
mmetsp:Transcript_60466/g.167511  ORF Transcript_60466/g.167511 Transcript_60466/m.167511 type:complete len:211 (+) Transcript_60466:316-948(+)